jgi:hypothetical protein
MTSRTGAHIIYAQCFIYNIWCFIYNIHTECFIYNIHTDALYIIYTSMLYIYIHGALIIIYTPMLSNKKWHRHLTSIYGNFTILPCMW